MLLQARHPSSLMTIPAGFLDDNIVPIQGGIYFACLIVAILLSALGLVLNGIVLVTNLGKQYSAHLVFIFGLCAFDFILCFMSFIDKIGTVLHGGFFGGLVFAI